MPTRRDMLKWMGLAGASSALAVASSRACVRRQGDEGHTGEQAAAAGPAQVRQRGGGASAGHGACQHRRSQAGLDVRELLSEHARHHGRGGHARRQAGYLRDHRRHRCDVAARQLGAGASLPAAGPRRRVAAAPVSRADRAPGALHPHRSLRQRVHAAIRPRRRLRWSRA